MSSSSTTQGMAQSASEVDLAKLNEFEYTFEWAYEAYDERFHVQATGLDSDAPKLHVEKKIARQGETLTADYDFAVADVQALRDAIAEFDLVAWANLPTRGYYNGSKHNTIRFEIGGEWYFMNDMKKYPETEPPITETAFARLYNLFNAYVSADAAMEAVWTEPQVEPADQPLWQDRVVMFKGREVHLVPGTGPGSNYYNAEIVWDRDVPWWVDEGFVGRWVMTEEDLATLSLPNYTSAELVIAEDGSVKLTLEDEEYDGAMIETRYYRDSGTGYINDRSIGEFDISFFKVEDGTVWHFNIEDARTSDHISFSTEGLPYPETKMPIQLAFTRVGQESRIGDVVR